MPEHACPYWVGYLLASPLRKLAHDPHKLLAPYVREGMTVVEPGPAMGFFTLELARLVGPHGKVVAIDVQPRMLAKLAQRARKAGLESRLDLREPKGDSMNVDDLAGQVDVVLASAVVHELPNVPLFFQEMHLALKPQGLLLLAEPPGHVTRSAWETTLRTAFTAGLSKQGVWGFRRFHAAVLSRI